MCLYLLLEQVPIIFILIYATLRGMINATETPIRQAVLPDLSVHLNTSCRFISFFYHKYMSLNRSSNCRIDTLNLPCTVYFPSAINVLLHCCSIVYTINLQDSW